jgi:hypothetical protein
VNLSSHELAVIHNALNEVVNGLPPSCVKDFAALDAAEELLERLIARPETGLETSVDFRLAAEALQLVSQCLDSDEGLSARLGERRPYVLRLANVLRS